MLDGGEVPPVVNCGAAGYRAATLDGFRITNGGRYRGPTIPPAGLPMGMGGGIRCDASSPVISHNEIVRNSLGDPFSGLPGDVAQGGGISLLGSHALVTGNTIADNEVLRKDGQGGGIYCEWSVADIVGNTIARNHAPTGPALYALYSRPRIAGNVIQANEHYYVFALYFGNAWGAVTLEGLWGLEIVDNLFDSNRATMGGGAIYLAQPPEGTIAGNVFRNNAAYNPQTSSGGVGGAIFLMTQASPRDDVKILGNTFVGNEAMHFLGERGGAIALILQSGRVVIANNVMAYNSSGIHRDPSTSFQPSLLDNAMWNGTQDYLNLAAGPGDFHFDPLFVDRPGGNYRLTLASPCVDSGSNPHATYPVDMDGATRIQDGRWTGTAIVDRGAYEYSPDFDGDGSADWRDPDDDGDGAADLSDCAPLNASAWSAPVPVRSVRLGGISPVTLRWDAQDPATRFDVAGGSLTAMLDERSFSNAECRADDLTAPPWADDRPGPAAGDARYYLLRAVSVCGDAGWGRSSGGEERAVDACP